MEAAEELATASDAVGRTALKGSAEGLRGAADAFAGASDSLRGMESGCSVQAEWLREDAEACMAQDAPAGLQSAAKAASDAASSAAKSYVADTPTSEAFLAVQATLAYPYADSD